MSDLTARDCTLVGGVVIGDFTVRGKTSGDLEERAREIAGGFADGRPWSVEIMADAVTNGAGVVVAWTADCTVTVTHATSAEATS